MEIKSLRKLIANPVLLHKKITFYEKKGFIQEVPFDLEEIKGHIQKSEHNLKFVFDNINLGYYDWCITGCYYAIYQIALALIRAKQVYSKSHDTTLCLLVRDYYNEGITKDDIELINTFFLDYQDFLIYIHTKNEREEASYSSKYNFDKDKVEEMRLKTVDFINKARGILNNI